MKNKFIVAEEYLDDMGVVYDSSILLDTDDENDATAFAESHVILDPRRTQVSIWEMDEDNCRESWVVKTNYGTGNKIQPTVNKDK